MSGWRGRAGGGRRVASAGLARGGEDGEEGEAAGEAVEARCGEAQLMEETSCVGGPMARRTRSSQSSGPFIWMSIQHGVEWMFCRV